MTNKRLYRIALAGMTVIGAACSTPSAMQRTENKTVPRSYTSSHDSTNSASVKWRTFFTDPYLTKLIDSALTRNQELNIVLQEMNISKNEIRARKGDYLPSSGIGVGAGGEKPARYTSRGANDATTEIIPGKEFPDPLPDYLVGVNASWEADIWKKLRNAKKSAVQNYLASVEGKNFIVTNLVSEIAATYYELIALDNQLTILKNTIDIQQNALEIVKQEKTAARVTELAVRKFEAEVSKNQSRQFYIQQKITEAENKINLLTGRFPQTVARSSQDIMTLKPDTIYNGVPSQLLDNRADIRQAARQLEAAKLNVKAAKAEFYPSLRITAGAGYEAFNPAYLITTPQSLLYSVAGDLMAPLINRNAIKAKYYSAGSKKIQAIYNYEQKILNAHIEVVNHLSNISNLKKSYDYKAFQVEALTKSIEISTVLFKSARADYMEVLLTQRDALESKFEMIEIKLQQMNARIGLYKSLGGGWR